MIERRYLVTRAEHMAANGLKRDALKQDEEARKVREAEDRFAWETRAEEGYA